MDRMLLRLGTVSLILLLLTGCWDRVEIEDRGFVVGVAIDLPNPEQTKEKDKADIIYELTTQLVVPNAIQQSQSGSGDGGNGGESGKGYINASAKGKSMHEANSKLAATVSRTPFYAHNTVLIVSEELARSGRFSDVVDFFIRDQEMRRETKVMIANGKDAKEILGTKTNMDQLPALYINSVAENEYQDIDIPATLRVGDLHQKLLVNSSFTVPAVVATEDRLSIASTAVFRGRDNRMIDWIHGKENEGLQFLKGELRGGALNVNFGDNLVVFRLERVKTKIEADVSDIEHILFTVRIDTLGTIIESLETIDYIGNNQIWGLLEQKTSEEIERTVSTALKKLHVELKLDVMDLDRHLYANHPEVWEKVKEDWDKGKNYFAMSDIDVRVHTQIRNAGVVNQTEPIQD